MNPELEALIQARIRGVREMTKSVRNLHGIATHWQQHSIADLPPRLIWLAGEDEIVRVELLALHQRLQKIANDLEDFIAAERAS